MNNIIRENTLIRFIIAASAYLITTMSFAAGVKSLPTNLKWETNEAKEFIGSPDAKKGGTLQDGIGTFPLTLRQVGPDSNGAFRSMLDDNDMS